VNLKRLSTDQKIQFLNALVKAYQDEVKYEQGVRVLGTTADLRQLVKTQEIDEVVITIAQAPRKAIRRSFREMFRSAASGTPRSRTSWGVSRYDRTGFHVEFQRSPRSVRRMSSPRRAIRCLELGMKTARTSEARGEPRAVLGPG
jgi:dihydrofolate reductase